MRTITIQSKSPRGHWRCGVFHGPESVVHPLARWTSDQVRRFHDDPMLLVVTSEDPAPVEPAAAPVAEVQQSISAVADPVTEKPKAPRRKKGV